MTKHGYEKTSITDVRKELIDDWKPKLTKEGLDDVWISTSKKSVLVEKLLELKKSGEVVAADPFPPDDIVLEDLIDDSEEIEEERVVNDVEVMPSFFSPGWSDYVMRRFEESELEGNSPTCDGCRRLVHNLIGPIVSVDISSNEPPTADNNFIATVVVSVQVKVTNDAHPAYRESLFYSDIANCGDYNCEDPYCRHQSATAFTRALGRCLKRILGLNKVLTAEESTDKAANPYALIKEEWSPSKEIDENQVDVIDMMCKRLDISVLGFINSGERQYKKITEVSHSTALKMIKQLNKIRSGESKNPRSRVGVYDEGDNNDLS